MRYCIILFISFLLSFSAQAQVSKTFTVCGEFFTYTAATQPDKSILVTIADNSNAARLRTFPYVGTDVETFKQLFSSEFNKLPSLTCVAADAAKLNNEANILWNDLQRRSLASLPQSYSKTLAIGNGSFTYTGTFDTDNSMKITIVDIADATKKVEYNYSGTDVTFFMAVFQRNFLRINGFTCTDPEKDLILKEGNNLWFQLIAIRPLQQPSAAPEAGRLSIFSQIKFYISYIDSATKKEEIVSSEDISVQDVDIEFNNGYIENISATILINGQPRTYINIYGIGFTSVENQNKLKSIRLYERGAKAFPDKERMTEAQASLRGGNRTYIILGELLDYKNKLEVDRRDYSPKDTSMTLFGGQYATLYKEETNKLFEARIYSDFVGLQDDKPNGLVQTEVEKRININTAQWQTRRWIFPVVKSVGIFQYILPNIMLSKLEEHNKHYILGDLDSIRQHPGDNDTASLGKNSHRYATPLGLYQRQSFSAGFDLNVLFLANHNLKFNIYLNIGGRLGITPVADSLTTLEGSTITKTGLVKEYTINTLQITPQLKLVFLPEERFNLSLSYRAIYIKPFAPGVELLGFTKDDPLKYMLQRNKWLNTLELLMSFNVNKNGDGKVFGRARFNSEIANYQNNFAQIQIGYSTYIFGRNK